MPMRPFYRSRLFWLGLPGLVFLLWAWWDSSVKGTFVNWAHGQREDSVSVGAGMVGWEGVEFHGVSGMADFWIQRESALPPPDGVLKREFLMPRAFVWERDDDVEEDGTMASRSLHVALWVVVMGYVAMWAGMVWLWQRRKARVVKKAGVPGDQ